MSRLPSLANPIQALLFTYGSALVFAALSLWLSADTQGLRPQLALMALLGSGVALWLGLLLVKPKPSSLPKRTRYTVLEYVLTALLLSAALVLFKHSGWQMSSQPPSGLMAILWGLGWVAAWLGPLALGVLTVVLAHWLGVVVYLDYRQAAWRWQGDRSAQRLIETLLPQLTNTKLLGPKDSLLVAQKLAGWINVTPNDAFKLALPASRLQLDAQPLARSLENHAGAQTVLITLMLAPLLPLGVSAADGSDSQAPLAQQIALRLDVTELQNLK